MNEYLRLLVAFIAAVNPAAVAVAMAARGGGHDARLAWRTPAIGLFVALVIYAVLASVAVPLLDWLQIEPETFRIAAGIVVAVGGVFALWRGRWGDPGRDPGDGVAIFPLALPLLAGPWGLAAVLSYSVDHGIGLAIGAAAPAVAVAAGLVAMNPAKGAVALDAIARITGALAVAIAAGLIVSGVRAI
jgi:multiple antibiotic resistance protein